MLFILAASLNKGRFLSLDGGLVNDVSRFLTCPGGLSCFLKRTIHTK